MTDTEKAIQQIIFLRILLVMYEDEDALKRLPKAKLVESSYPKYLKSGNKTIEFDPTLAAYLVVRNPKPDSVLQTIEWLFEDWKRWPLLNQNVRNIVESIKREMKIIKIGL